MERLAWVLGLVLLAGYLFARIDSRVAQASDIESFRTARTEFGLETANLPVDFELWDQARIAAYQESLTRELDLPMALLRIPDISLEVPVHDGTDELVLNRGVGRIVGTSRPGQGGNLGIAGHRDGFFRGLKDLEEGARIEIELLDRVESYVVNQISIVDPSDVQVLEPSDEPALTLVTCYPFYYVGKAPKRYIVKAELDETRQQQRANQEALDLAEEEPSV